MVHKLAEPIKNILLQNTKVENNCGILLSAGVDSTSLLLSLLENNIKPTVISFRVEGTISTDWSAARSNAKKLGLDFMDIEIQKDIENLIVCVEESIKQGLVKKADIECFVPVMLSIKKIANTNIKTLFTGSAADGHYGLSRKAVIQAHTGNNLDDCTWLDAFREKYFMRVNPAQTKTVTEYGKNYDIKVVSPYTDSRLLDVFKGSTWRELNKPLQKMPVRDAFPDMKKLNVGKQHINLQLGDSGIAKLFESLLESRMNTKNWKSVIGIYNSMAKEKQNA